MSNALLCLHGYTQNGNVMRAMLAPWKHRLPADLTLLCPDGSHVCAPASVDRLYAMMGGQRAPGPHYSWWDASDDGLVYHGWEATRERLGNELAAYDRVGVLGFSQGAMLSSIVCALSARGELPPLQYAVLIAGRKPRASLMQPWYEQPIAVPSLHVCGERDRNTLPNSEALFKCFEPAVSRFERWPGPHAIPAHGSAADAIVDFIAARAGKTEA